MIKKINNLTKIFIKDYYNNLNIFNKKNKKVNIKNIYVWLILILIISITYLSLEIITYLSKTGNPALFLKIYLPIVATIFIYQLIALICGVFYYSKDIKDILFLPLKPLEILIAKLNTVIAIMYFMEGLMLLIPLTMYGLLVQQTIAYFIFEIFVLAIFPILFTLIIGTLIILAMKILSKIIKNKEFLQLIIVLIFALIFSLIIGKILGEILPNNITENIMQGQTIEIKINEINEKYIIINPIINILTNNQIINIIINLIKIIVINILAFIIFAYIGTKTYLKDVLKIMDKINTKKIINFNYKYKKENKIKSYIKNDIKKTIKNPTFFIQNILQYIFIALICALMLNLFLPLFMEQIKADNTIQEIGVEEFKLQAILIAVGIVQIIFTFSNLAITAISREGKNAVFMKYIPISLYTQFKLKTLPQIVINTIVILIISCAMYTNLPEISIVYFIIGFITAMLINLINSYLLVLIDLNKPNLNWTNSESIVKDNGNKLYQYVMSVITFLILSYFSKIFKGMSFINSILIINILLLITFIILKILIKKNINKIFEKIY